LTVEGAKTDEPGNVGASLEDDDLKAAEDDAAGGPDASPTFLPSFALYAPGPGNLLALLSTSCVILRGSEPNPANEGFEVFSIAGGRRSYAPGAQRGEVLLREREEVRGAREVIVICVCVCKCV